MDRSVLDQCYSWCFGPFFLIRSISTHVEKGTKDRNPKELFGMAFVGFFPWEKHVDFGIYGCLPCLPAVSRNLHRQESLQLAKRNICGAILASAASHPPRLVHQEPTRLTRLHRLGSCLCQKGLNKVTNYVNEESNQSVV